MNNQDLVEQCACVMKLSKAGLARLDEIARLAKLLMSYAERIQEVINDKKLDA